MRSFDAEADGENAGHARYARLAVAQVAFDRIVEQVRRVESRIADQALWVDRQPAAWAEKDVLVVDVAMQRNGRALFRQQALATGAASVNWLARPAFLSASALRNRLRK